MPLWLDVVRGQPDWEAVFAGFQSTTDYPACTYWRELAAFYPHAKVILTVRDADGWFDSVSETIFSPKMQGSLAGSPVGAMMQGVIFDAFGGRANDRAFMTDWFVRRNQSVVDSFAARPAPRLLAQGRRGDPSVAFLGVPVPDAPFPRVNSRDEISQAMSERRGLRPTPRRPREIRARVHRRAESQHSPPA